MNDREFKKSNKKKYTLWLTDEEKKLLEVRAEQYGYLYLSEYLRDAGIYNDVIQVDISYTEQVNNLFQELINEIKKLTKEVRRVMKYNTSATTEETEMIQQALYRVYSQTKSLKKSVNDNVNVKEIIKKSKIKLYKNEIKNEFDNIINSSINDTQKKTEMDAIIYQIKLASESIKNNDKNSKDYNEGWQECISFIREIIEESINITI